MQRNSPDNEKEIDPGLLAGAIQSHQAGDFQGAEAAYRGILEAQPDHPDALHLLGVLFYQSGKSDAAVDHIKRAILVNPSAPAYHSNLGAALIHLGRMEEAASSCREALRLNPDYPDAMNNLGGILKEQGKLGEAVEVFRRALSLSPDSAELNSNLGLALKEQESLGDARRHLEKATRLQPGFPDAHNNLGTVLVELGDLAGGVRHYERAIAPRPDYAEAHSNLGTALRALGRLNEAEASLKRAIAARPEFANAHNNLGSLYQDKKETERAAECYREAIRLAPGVGDYHANLGNVLRTLGEAGAAVEAFEKSIALKPTAGARIRAATVLPVISASHSDLRHWRERFEREVDALLREKVTVEDPFKEVGTTNFFLAYHGQNDRDLQVKAGRLYASLRRPARPRETRRGEKIRLGLISKHFNNHTIGKLFRGLIAEFSRERFDVVIFSVGRKEDAIARIIEESADEYIVIPEKWGDAHRMIMEEDLDVLFFTDIGMEAVTYFLAFTRYAPVQCTAWGHPVTTGIDTIDYFLSTKDLEIENPEAHYSEKPIRLNNLFPYFYRPASPDPMRPRSHFGLSEDDHIYCCPQTLFKFHPDFDGILENLFHRDPKGRLVLISAERESWNGFLMDRFRATAPGVAERVQFVPRQKGDGFLNLIALSDVILDPVHFGGGLSSFETLSVGAPIVTMPSEFLRGRITYAEYKKMGVMDCIARSPEEYVELALRLGTDPGYRKTVKSKIQENSHVLFEDVSAVRELEEFFLWAVGQADAEEAARDG